jgi:hypothetical protein
VLSVEHVCIDDRSTAPQMRRCPVFLDEDREEDRERVLAVDAERIGP